MFFWVEIGIGWQTITPANLFQATSLTVDEPQSTTRCTDPAINAHTHITLNIDG
jgi:hypothetical protein